MGSNTCCIGQCKLNLESLENLTKAIWKEERARKWSVESGPKQQKPTVIGVDVTQHDATTRLPRFEATESISARVADLQFWARK